MKQLLAGLTVAILAGCASYGAGGLVVGKSTAAETEAKMGAPAERLAHPDGGATLYYPWGRQTYAVELGPDGIVRAVEQRLARANLGKLVAGTSTRHDVRALFGPPRSITRMDRQERDAWEYRYMDYQEYRVIWVQFSYDGIVREMLDMRDWDHYLPWLPGFR